MNTDKFKIHVCKDADKLTTILAADFQNAVNQATKMSRNLHVAFSGSGTPALFFQKLAFAPYGDDIAWQNVHFFWGDERCVPPDLPDSNYGMTKKLLFDFISIPDVNIHRIFGENTPEDEAKRYANEIIQCVTKNNQGLPQFDWILLGLGTDGYTASIFPDSSILHDRRIYVPRQRIQKQDNNELLWRYR